MGKSILMKPLRLQKAFDELKANPESRPKIFQKFKSVWGSDVAGHFLWKYDNAESLIYALDQDNLKLFIDNY